MSLPLSFIKNAAFPLRKDYEFINAPWKDNWLNDPKKDRRPRYIGRKKHIDKMESFLEQKRGVFLVTGYRGMGKTSFVNYVVGRLKNRSKSLNAVHLTIAQNKPAEVDILRQVVVSIYDKVRAGIESAIFPPRSGTSAKEKIKEVRRIALMFLRYALIISMLIIIALIVNDIFVNQLKKAVPWAGWMVHFISSNIKYFIFVPILAIAGYSALYIYTYKLRLLKHRLKNDELYIRVKWMAERAFTLVSEDISTAGDGPFQFEFKGFKGMFGEKTGKRVKDFPIAQSKELEYELKTILQIASKRGYEFIFVFDELDKIDFPDATTNLYADLNAHEATVHDSNFQTALRNRKQAVMSIIAGLKNFFSTSDAAFIFIAGREMFDASLADISDKQSPLSSIFTYIFNIESFLKEEEGYEGEQNTSSLTNAIEEFLKYQLCTEEELCNDNTSNDITGIIDDPKNSGTKVKLRKLSLLDYTKYAYPPPLATTLQPSFVDDELREYGKLYFMLQTFVTYLAYRSNGSPKKLLKTFHEFVKIDDGTLLCSPEQYILAKRTIPESTRYYLSFNYHDQYRTGFINYFYRPFLIQSGRSFKLYSDNAIISIPYLFDHLFRFHPYAFSRANLELVPELLSSNKTPSIKKDLDQIITYLSNSHVRETDIELFEYKFYSKSTNEVSFLSRVFEEEAAAFNFTLDESYAIKLLLNEKIKELRSIYSRFHKDEQEQIFSIAYHNGNLGDLNFFDQEYDDAIANYSDAIRPINSMDVNKMNLRDFVTVIRNKLKIGLCLEKVNSYEEALTFYTDAAQDAKRFIAYQLYKGKSLDFEYLNPGKSTSSILPPIPQNFKSSAINDLLQIVAQCFLAKIYIQEKMGLEGTTNNKIKMEIGEFLKLTDGVGYLYGQNHLQTSNFFSHLGKMVYYKNSNGGNKHNRTAIIIPNNYPGWMAQRFSILREKFESHIAFKNNRTKRQSTLSLIYYIVGLDEVMRARSANWGKEEKVEDGFNLLSDNGDYNILPGYFKQLRKYLRDGHQRYTTNHYKSFAGFLSSIGDCLLGRYDLKRSGRKTKSPSSAISMVDWKIEVKEIFANVAISEGKTDRFLCALSVSDPQNFSVADIFRSYYLAAKFYERAGHPASGGFEYRKILHALRLITKTGVGNSLKINNQVIKLLRLEIVKPALMLAAQGTGRANRHMVNKAKNYEPLLKKNFIENNIANHPDTREITLLFEYTKMKLIGASGNIKHIIHPCNSIATQYTRLFELDFYAGHLYSSKLRKWLNSRSTKTILKLTKVELDDVVEYLFTVNSLIRTLRIYGQDYMLGHSFIAYTHFRIASFLQKIRLSKDDKHLITVALNRLFGAGSMVFTDYGYHFQKAYDHYGKALQLHTAGNEYKKTVRNMIYLEDDFTDNAYHFGAALDRYMMVRNVFNEHMELCRNNGEQTMRKNKNHV